jgi:hypothetical protein
MITLTPLNNPEGATQQEYNSSQEVLIPVVDSTSEFNPVTDQIIFSVETITGELLSSGKVSSFNIRNYENTLNEDQISSVVVYPIKDLKDTGYNIGIYNVYYNFYKTALKSDQYKFFIQEISPSRTEVRLSVNNISNEEINSLVQEFQTILEGTAFKDFYININGSYYIANNILIDNTSIPSTVLIKLYQPLPSQIKVNSQLQVVLETAETVGFNLNLPPEPLKVEEDIQYIKGPNFNFQLSDQVNNSTLEYDYNSLINNSQLTSSYNELENILNQKGIKVNIDYSDFENFIQFSSAEQRLLNFYYKVGQIEDYNNSIDLINSITGSTSSSLQVSSSRATYQAQITDIIRNFDGYENYLYYTSGALAYPKSNSTQPYVLYSTGSSEVLTWLGSTNETSAYYGGRLLTASFYDDENQDNLLNTIPNYLREDPANAGYELFLNMIGQHFDIIYSYVNTLTERYNGDNRLDYGISKDLVADALRGAGVKLYQNNFSSDNLYSALLGINVGGDLLPPTGSEVIETYITASNVAVPLDNVNKETYKRLYHNLSYLLKKKGTVEGLRALINCFGIPDTILRISEFGGKDKDNSNDWDYFQDMFNHFVYISGSNSTQRVTAEFSLESNWNNATPKEVLFRFKPELPTSDNTQNFRIISHFRDVSGDQDAYLTLARSGSWTASGSYSGSIVSESRDYAELSYWSEGNEVTSIIAPFYDGNWWGVSITSGSGEFTLRAANKIYNGNNGFKIGYTASATDSYSSDNAWGDSSYFYFPSQNGTTAVSLGGRDYYGLTGSYQELRYYDVALSENTFHDFVMNPHSIEGLYYSSSAQDLVFRAPLGSELKDIEPGTYDSTHPKITGSYITNSFDGSSTYTIGSGIVFPTQTEFYYYDQPAVGIKNRISEKVRSQTLSLPLSGDTLSSYRSIQQNYPQSSSNYTKDINYVEVAFSPQNEINDDINSSFGYFNIGDYIGDPRLFFSSSTSYPDLDILRNDYFDKYYKNYDWVDYVRLIKYFDNSLFKMIQDFVPAKSGLATGVVIKQHLLERNRHQPAQVEFSQHDYSASIESGFISGGTGGTFSELNVLGNVPEGQSQGFTNDIAPFITQSWVYDVDTPFGPHEFTQSTQDEFYNGEFSGSNFVATTGELNDENTAKKPSVIEINYDIIFFTSSISPAVPFLNANSSPNQGEIYLWYDTGSYINTGQGSTPIANQSSFTGG